MVARNAGSRLVVLGVILSALLWFVWSTSRTAEPAHANAPVLESPTVALAPVPTSATGLEAVEVESARIVERSTNDAPVAAPIRVVNEAPRRPAALRGRVTDTFGNALRGVVIRAAIGRGQERIKLANGTTDADGSYRIELPRVRSVSELETQLRRARLNLDDDARDAGDVQRSGRARLDELRRRGPRGSTEFGNASRSLPQPLQLQVQALLNGFTDPRISNNLQLPFTEDIVVDFELALAEHLGGRVALPGCEGSAYGAQVFAIDDNDGLIASTWNNDSGGYTLLVPEHVNYRLFARLDGVGTAFVDGFIFERGVRAPDVCLKGPAQLRVRVVYPDGDAVVALPVAAQHEAALPLIEHGLGEVERMLLEKGDGLMLADGMTNERSEVHFTGLREGRFALRFSDVDEVLQPTGLFAASEGRHELVFRGSRLAVTVESHVSGERDTPQLECTRIARDGAPPREVHGCWFDDRHWYATVEADESYIVRAWSETTLEDWAVVAIPPASFETKLKLELFSSNTASIADLLKARANSPDAARYLGTLELAVVDEKKLRFPGGWQAKLVSATTGRTPRGFERFRPEPLTTKLQLPPDIYELSVFEASTSALIVFPAKPTRVEIASGKNTVVELQGVRGGRVRLSTLAPDDPPSLDDELEDLEEQRAATVTAFVRALGEPVSSDSPLLFDFEPDDLLSSVFVDDAHLRLGRAALCKPTLAPGRYTVTVIADNGMRRVYDIVITASKLTEIDFSLPR